LGGRSTSLKAIVVNALRRELAPAQEVSNPDPEKFELGPLGFLVVKRRPDDVVASQQIQAIQERLDEEEFQRAVNPRLA